MKQRFMHFERNKHGRDLVVGDIQGYFARLKEELKRIQFNPEKDRLFSTGDIVNRGPESHWCIEWMNYPWFHPVTGNHELRAISYGHGWWKDTADFNECGGQWMIDMSPAARKLYAEKLEQLPIALEVEMPNGDLKGVIHSEVFANDWSRMREELESPKHDKQISEVRNLAMWSRKKFEGENPESVENIHTVFVGHTTVLRPRMLGNVMYCDTAGWTENGYFALIDMATLESNPPPTTASHWAKGAHA